MDEQVEKRRSRRASDKWLPKLLIISTAVNLIAVVLIGAGSVGVVRNSLGLDDAEVALERIEAESLARVEQDCLKEERDHAGDVRQLRRTYRFLLDYPVANRDDPLFVAILQLLPQTESAARTDNAPDYCDDPGVGLPEPDPKIPERPKALDELLG